MATVKGIIVNDGGAPARIINFKAGEDISAGETLYVSGTDTVKLSGGLGSAEFHPIAGIALTDASNGGMCSVVTGSGVVLYAMTLVCTEGDFLAAQSTTAGALDNATGSEETYVAIALEAQGTAGALTKVLVV